MERLSFFLDPLPATLAAERLAEVLDDLHREVPDGGAPIEAAFILHLLGGGRPLRPGLAPALLRRAARRASGLPDWLFDECHRAVGDLAETVALTLGQAGAPHAQRLALTPGLLPSPPSPFSPSSPSSPSSVLPQPDSTVAWTRDVLAPLRARPDADQALVQAWQALDGPAREVGIRLSFGRWPAVLAIETLQAAVARHAGLPPSVIARRWAAWTDRRRPSSPDGYAAWLTDWQALVAPLRSDEADAPPSPSHWPVLEGPVEDRPALLGPVEDWVALQDLGGLPVRLVRRLPPDEPMGPLAQPEGILGVQAPQRGGSGGRAPPADTTRLWTHDQRLLDAAFPDLIAAASSLDAPLVLDGVLLPREPGGTLQPRLGRTPPSAQVCQRTPVRLRVFEVIEGCWSGPPSPFWEQAEAVPLRDWDSAEGLLIQRRGTSGGSVGATRWRLPALPLTAQVLLLHVQAQAGSGRDTDCTLAVWNRAPRDAREADAVIEAIARQQPPDPSPDALVLLPLARCTIGPSGALRARIDRVVRESTVARHGPVRSLRPGLVLSMAFDAIEANPRRRSGVMVREPRLLGLQQDLPPQRASNLLELLAQADQRRTRFGCQ